MATLVAILVCSTDACEICLLSCAWFQTLARRSDQCVECILTYVCVYDVEWVSDIFRFRYIGIDIYIYIYMYIGMELLHTFENSRQWTLLRCCRRI